VDGLSFWRKCGCSGTTLISPGDSARETHSKMPQKLKRLVVNILG
jgi:hypothetical protein